MMRVRDLTAALGVWVALVNSGDASEIKDLSDIELLSETRSAVAANDAGQTLLLMQEMRRRGVGLFAAQGKGDACEEEIELPATITDWRFRAVARQAYFRAAKSRQIESGACGCLFDGYSFDDFVQQALGKRSAGLNDSDRGSLQDIRDQDRSETEAAFRIHLQRCGER